MLWDLGHIPRGCRSHARLLGTHQGTSCRAGMGAASLRWQGIRAVLEGETGGFPLIIYSLSLGNQAASTAKLSLLVPGPFEAGGCLSSLSGLAALTPSCRSQLGTAPHTCGSALRANWGPYPLPETEGCPCHGGQGCSRAGDSPGEESTAAKPSFPKGQAAKHRQGDGDSCPA